MAYSMAELYVESPASASTDCTVQSSFVSTCIPRNGDWTEAYSSQKPKRAFFRCFTPR